MFSCCFKAEAAVSWNASNRDSLRMSAAASSTITTNDALTRPRGVTSALQAPKFVDVATFSRWERIIKDYEDGEDDYMEQYPEDAHHLELLRNDPAKLISNAQSADRLGSYRVDLVELAGLRLEVINSGGEHTLAADDDEHGGSIKRNTMITPPRPPSSSDSRISSTQSQQGGNHRRPPLSSTESSKSIDSMSKAWATKLSMRVSPLQGKISLSGSSRKPGGSKKNVAHIKQAWPLWLVDESFDVVKINAYGRKYDRSLKLTQYHILAISDKGITKVYTYDQIQDVLVDMDGTYESVSLKFRDNTKEHAQFQTPMAAHIAQQITTRIQIRRQLDRQRAGITGSSNMGMHLVPQAGVLYEGEEATTDNFRPSIAGDSNASGAGIESDTTVAPFFPSYSTETIRGIMQSIGSENIKSKSSSTLSFAEALVEQLIPDVAIETSSVPTAAAGGGGSRVSVRVRKDQAGNRMSVGRPTSMASISENTATDWETGTGATDPTTSDTERSSLTLRGSLALRGSTVDLQEEEGVAKMDKLASSLVVVEPNSKEFFVQKALQKLMFEERARECLTRLKFIEDTKKNITDGSMSATDIAQNIRMWVEGMHEYILMKRGTSLATIYILGGTGGASGVGTRDATVATADISSDEINRILDKNLQFATEALGDDMQCADDEEEQNGFNPLKFLRRSTLLAISYLAYVVIEESVYLPLKAALAQAFARDESTLASRDRTLHEKCHRLKHLSQDAWQIPSKQISAVGWDTAIFELKALELQSNPSRGILAIVSTAKSIFAEYEANHLKLSNLGKAEALGADDLVPIFIYVLVQAGLKTPLYNKDLLWSMCHPSQLYGESGYYLTVYESAVSYIEDFEG
jgi:hypothetical protein